MLANSRPLPLDDSISRVLSDQPIECPQRQPARVLCGRASLAGALRHQRPFPSIDVVRGSRSKHHDPRVTRADRQGRRGRFEICYRDQALAGASRVYLEESQLAESLRLAQGTELLDTTRYPDGVAGRTDGYSRTALHQGFAPEQQSGVTYQCLVRPKGARPAQRCSLCVANGAAANRFPQVAQLASPGQSAEPRIGFRLCFQTAQPRDESVLPTP